MRFCFLNCDFLASKNFCSPRSGTRLERDMPKAIISKNVEVAGGDPEVHVTQHVTKGGGEPNRELTAVWEVRRSTAPLNFVILSFF